jgi:hypothetical protein
MRGAIRLMDLDRLPQGLGFVRIAELQKLDEAKHFTSPARRELPDNALELLDRNLSLHSHLALDCGVSRLDTH